MVILITLFTFFLCKNILYVKINEEIVKTDSPKNSLILKLFKLSCLKFETTFRNTASMLCRNSKLIAFHMFEKLVVKELLGRVGPGRADPLLIFIIL